jgi:hypothetical protein
VTEIRLTSGDSGAWLSIVFASGTAVFCVVIALTAVSQSLIFGTILTSWQPAHPRRWLCVGIAISIYARVSQN